MSIYKIVYDLSKKVADEGFDWDHWAGAYHKVEEELHEVRQEALHSKGPTHEALIEEFGDLILSVMSLARHLGIDPEEACQVGVRKFTQRYDWYKEFTKAKGVDIKTANQEKLSLLWQEYKESLKETLRSGAIGED